MPQAPDKLQAMADLVKVLNEWQSDTCISRLQILFSVMTDAELVMYKVRLNTITGATKEHDHG